VIKAVFPESSSLLLVGSPGIGLLEFSLSLTKDYMEGGETVIFITVDTLPIDLIEQMEVFGISRDRLGKDLFIIDYHSSLLGAIDAVELSHGDVRRVSDLEGVMFNIGEIANQVKKPVKVVVHSLSTLFLYNQSNVVVKFFQISSSRVRTEYGSAIFTLYEGVHDEKTVNHLMAIADGVVELKFDCNLNRQMRVRHMKGFVASSQWIPFEIKQVKGEQCDSLLEWKES